MNWFYYFGRVLSRTVMFVTLRVHVTGLKNVPKNGPLLVICNHISIADPPLIGASILSRNLVFMAKEELFETPVIGYFIRGFGAFPVKREGMDLSAMKTAQKTLDDGLVLMMFPEGRRSKTGMIAGLAGSALLATRKGIPLLPVGLWGTEQIKGKTWWLHRPRINIKIGEPFTLSPAKNRTELEARTQEMMLHIAALVPPGYQGVYRDDSK